MREKEGETGPDASPVAISPVPAAAAAAAFYYHRRRRR